MMVHRYACESEDCDTYVDSLTREGVPHCECGEPLQPVGMVGCVTGVSNDLRPAVVELAGDLRARAFEAGSGMYAEGLSEAAEELEDMVDTDEFWATEEGSHAE